MEEEGEMLEELTCFKKKMRKKKGGGARDASAEIPGKMVEELVGTGGR